MAYHNSDAESFVMDDLGNRTGNQTLRGEGTVHFAADPLINRYTAINAATLAYDAAGNLTQDKDGYQFTYDYENRIVEIRNSSNELIAEFDYDTQGRRIRVYDAVADTTTLYYYSDEWQVLSTYVGGSLDKSFVYGNYIDEVLVMNQGASDYFYLHDHLYSPAVLLSDAGSVVERYEYDAYGNVHIMDVTYNVRTSSNYGNPFYLTGRGLDVFDGGAYAAYDYRHRTYGPEIGRMYQHDPHGIVPDNCSKNRFRIHTQYLDGLNLYNISRSNLLRYSDPFGLFVKEPEIGEGNFNGRYIYTCQCGWLDSAHYDSLASQFETVLKAVEEAKSNQKQGLIPTLRYGGAFADYYAFYSVNGANIKGLTYEIVLGILEDLSVRGEGHQSDGIIGLIGGTIGYLVGADSTYSYEDLATNWVGLITFAGQYYGQGDRARLLEKYCGPILSTEEAKCLFRNMSIGEKLSKQQTTAPVLFGSTYRGPKCKTCIGSKPSWIFSDILPKAQAEFLRVARLDKEYVDIKGLGDLVN